MRRRLLGGILALILLAAGTIAPAEGGSPEVNAPLTAEELAETEARVLALAEQAVPLNDPPAEAVEDGYAWQYDFGVVYLDGPEKTAESRVSALQIMDAEVPGPRGIAVDWTVNQVMNAIPCGNPGMYGTFERAVLYLEGSPEDGFSYGEVQRDGQRISAMEYGVWNPETERKNALILGISGDGVTSVRLEGMNEPFPREEAREFFGELESLTGVYSYDRVPRSGNGAELAMFSEEDLDFRSLSYRTAEPVIFGDNVEDMMIDNEDGTWIRRIDGEGFEAVFRTNSAGGEAQLVSFTILSPDLEGPRCVRLGDLFHEDFTRFRSGEGALSEDGTTEVLYGTVGTAPYGVAEYGDGTEMTLRYVTPTLGGPDVELLLKYRDTVLTEIILHDLEEDE